MTRKAGTVPEETRSRIIKSAEKEFAELGYEKASLRHICANAGVTTGALYFFFRDKDDLFMSVAEPVLNGLSNVLREHYSVELNEDISAAYFGEDEDFHFGDMFIDLCFQYETIMKIVVSNLNHPQVKAFADGVMDATDEQTRQIVRKMQSIAPTPIDDIYDEYFIHWFSHLQFDMVLHMATHHDGISREDAQAEMRKMIKFLRNGFFGLLKA